MHLYLLPLPLLELNTTDKINHGKEKGSIVLMFIERCDTECLLCLQCRQWTIKDLIIVLRSLIFSGQFVCLFVFYVSLSTVIVNALVNPQSTLNPTGVRPHDLQIMDSTFHIPEKPLTTEPWGTVCWEYNYRLVSRYSIWLACWFDIVN